MDPNHRDSAGRVRSRLEREPLDSSEFRAALMAVPQASRDAWIDVVFGIDAVPDDGPGLPRGCVPYLPSSVDALLRVIDWAQVRRDDVFVDIGSGLGRATALVHLLTGASAVGIEIQPGLIAAARELSTRLLITPRVSCIEGDAVTLAGSVTKGSVFFLYCPFSGERLDRVLAALEAIARTRTIRVCCVDLPAIERPWLIPARLSGDLTVYRSTLLDTSDVRRNAL